MLELNQSLENVVRESFKDLLRDTDFLVKVETRLIMGWLLFSLHAQGGRYCCVLSLKKCDSSVAICNGLSYSLVPFCRPLDVIHGTIGRNNLQLGRLRISRLSNVNPLKISMFLCEYAH